MKLTDTIPPHWRQRLRTFFVEEVSPWCYTRRYHANCYYDGRRNVYVTAIYGLHYVLLFAWWLGWKWDKHRLKKSWIDELLRATSKESRK